MFSWPLLAVFWLLQEEGSYVFSPCSQTFATLLPMTFLCCLGWLEVASIRSLGSLSAGQSFSLLKSRQIYLSQMLTNQLGLNEGEAACSWNFLALQILCWDTYSSVSPGAFIVTGFTNKIQFYWFFGKFILKNNLSWISNSLIKVITSWVTINNPCFLTITNE